MNNTITTTNVLSNQPTGIIIILPVLYLFLRNTEFEKLETFPKDISFILFCLTYPYPLPKRVRQKLRSGLPPSVYSIFSFLLRLYSSFLHLLPRLPVTSILQ
jgi:hypothetical protein